MIERRDSREIGAKKPTVRDIGEDDLIRLVRILAREAAQEAFAVFMDARKGHSSQAPPLPNRSRLTDHRSDGSTMNKSPSPASDERSLSVQEAAARAGVSQKTIRRRIKSGELPALRFGKLYRIRESDLFPRSPRDRPGGTSDQ
jgi:excisionase family DNA binding protein